LDRFEDWIYATQQCTQVKTSFDAFNTAPPPPIIILMISIARDKKAVRKPKINFQLNAEQQY